jgi:hypothetical protein
MLFQHPSGEINNVRPKNLCYTSQFKRLKCMLAKVLRLQNAWLQSQSPHSAQRVIVRCCKVHVYAITPIHEAAAAATAAAAAAAPRCQFQMTLKRQPRHISK